MISKSENNAASWILFFLFPFATFVYALKNFFNKNSQRLILAFSFLYGYSVFVTSGDIARYEQGFYDIVMLSWGDFEYLLTNFMNPMKRELYDSNVLSNKPDIFALITSFTVSRFTDNPRWFWAIISLINTFLIIKFTLTISREITWFKNLASQRIFFIGLALMVPFFYGVIGIRFWPALFFFMIYAIRFLKQKKFKYLFIAALSILMHYSFIVPFSLLLLAYLVPKSKMIYKSLVLFGVVIFAFSSVSSSLNTIKSISNNFQETTIEDSANSYTDEEVLNERIDAKKGNNWYVQLKDDLILYFFLIIGILDVLGILVFRENSFLKRMYPLFVVFLILVLLTKDLGSISRFKYIYYLLFLSRYAILVGIQPYNGLLRYISYSFAPILLLYVVVTFRAGFYTVEPLLLVNNSVLTFFMHSDMSLSEFLIGH